jgi:transposase
MSGEMQRTHGRRNVGERVLGCVTGKREKRTNIIGAWSYGKGLFATKTYENITINRERFTGWIKECLVPHLSAGKVVIMDNAPWHKGDEINNIIEKTGARLVFLPPYSPDLNPIEHAWANLKKFIKKLAHKTLKLSEKIHKYIKDKGFSMAD